MDDHDPTGALAALGQETRYAALRLLVDAGEEGLSAGDLARTLDVAPSNMTFHMSNLSQSGLTTSERRGQSIIYKAVPEALRRLVARLQKDLDRSI